MCVKQSVIDLILSVGDLPLDIRGKTDHLVVLARWRCRFIELWFSRKHMSMYIDGDIRINRIHCEICAPTLPYPYDANACSSSPSRIPAASFIAPVMAIIAPLSVQ
jgi:hypothetical protein